MRPKTRVCFRMPEFFLARTALINVGRADLVAPRSPWGVSRHSPQLQVTEAWDRPAASQRRNRTTTRRRKFDFKSRREGLVRHRSAEKPIEPVTARLAVGGANGVKKNIASLAAAERIRLDPAHADPAIFAAIVEIDAKPVGSREPDGLQEGRTLDAFSPQQAHSRTENLLPGPQRSSRQGRRRCAALKPCKKLR